MLAKIGWRVIHDSRNLWARVLHSKYKIGTPQTTSWLVAKGTWSSTWRSVCVSLREVIIPGLRWVLGDGNQIKFWTDHWIMNIPLLEEATIEVPPALKELTARDLWRQDTGWDLTRIIPYVSHEVRLNLASVVVDTVTGAHDRLAWSASQDGRFTVSSAYSVLTRNLRPRPDMGSFFGQIWKIKVPERVRVFFWLVGNQAIMTNTERHRRHLSDSNICQVCRGGEESIIHVLRDCPAISGVWRRVVPRNKQRLFFEQSLLEWIYGNLRDVGVIDTVPWPTLFALVAWWGWKWRCDNVFGGNGRCRDRIRFVKELPKEVWQATTSLSTGPNAMPREEQLIAWTYPSTGWIKLNTDGASRGNPGLAAAGGILRDEHGEWIQGFAINIGVCSAPLAELWGVYYGLYVAWERRITRVELEVDSELVVGFLTKGISDTHPLSFLVRLCYGFLSKDWTVRISHVYREANRLADGLANYAFSQPLGFHLLDACPDCMQFIALEDIRGTTYPRRVRL